MSFLDIFTSKPAEVAPVAPVAAPPAQGNIPGAPTVVAEPGNPNAPVVAAPVVAPVEPVVPEKPENPLEEFKGLWETTPIKEGEQPPAPVELKAEDIQKIMAKADFSNAIAPETLEAITAGGEGATTAFATAMNQVVQQAMTQSIIINQKLTEKAVNEAVTAEQAKLPDMLRQQAAADHAKTQNPIFKNPAVKPVIEATQAQLLLKFPNATPTEITEMTQNYIIAMGKSFAPEAVINDNGPEDTDWGKFMEP